LVGEFDLSGFGKSKARSEKIKTTFSINEDGILNVTAENLKPGAASTNIEVSAVGAIEPAEMARMIKEADEYAEEDKRLAKNLKARIMLEEMINRIATHPSGKGKAIAEEAE
jgi:molecular chaperone DnaK (HSP70)